ncbi:MAG: DUF2946 family protein [Burkholderiales bacterium]|nr:DUF2946 family protein [Burkholderiales bacterium]
MALNALWPLIAQLNPATAATHLADCTELGMHPHQHEETAGAPAEPSPLTPNCSFCTLVAGGFTVLVAARIDVVPLVVGTHAPPPAAPQTQHASFFPYSLAHPRAPPAFS